MKHQVLPNLELLLRAAQLLLPEKRSRAREVINFTFYINIIYFLILNNLKAASQQIQWLFRLLHVG